MSNSFNSRRKWVPFVNSRLKHRNKRKSKMALSSLDDFDIGEIDGVTRSLDPGGLNKYCPHIPTEKQRAFLDCSELEAMYGGAAGGGKSDALLMGALSDVDKPGFQALLLRRTFRDLNQPKAIMHRCHEWLRGTDAIWSAENKRYTFPGSGAQITFGYFDNEGHKDQYASAEFHYIGWDELTQFPERWYTWMFSRLRRTRGSNIRTRVRSATNPGSIGHVWVKKRFVDITTAKGRFFPARLEDNPHIDQEGYRESLSKLDPVTRNQLEKGLWTVDASALIYTYDVLKNVILSAPDCPRKVLALDYGLVNDAFSATILGYRPKDPVVYILQSWKKMHVVPSEANKITNELNESHKFEGIVGDAGGLGRAYVEDARYAGIPVEAADKNNKRGYIGLYVGELDRSRVKIVESACRQLLDEYDSLPWSDETRTKEDPNFENHCSDGALYGWRRCRAFYAASTLPMPGAVPSPFAKW